MTAGCIYNNVVGLKIYRYKSKKIKFDHYLILQVFI